MGRIVAIFNQKGGVGKTATVNNLAFELQARDKKVLVIDADQQENLSVSLGVMPSQCKATIYDLLLAEIHDEPYKKDLSNIIVHTKYGIDLIPGSLSMAEMDKFLYAISPVETPVEEFLRKYENDEDNMRKKVEDCGGTTPVEQFLRLHKSYTEAVPYFLKIAISKKLIRRKDGTLILRNILARISDNYDYIIIDCPPSLSAVTINILNAADRVIVPTTPDPFAISGLINLVSTMNSVRAETNPGLKFSGMLYTMVEKNRVVVRELMAQSEENIARYIYIYDTCIPRSTAVNQAFASGVPLIKLSKSNPTRLAYSAFCDEFLEREEI